MMAVYPEILTKLKLERGARPLSDDQLIGRIKAFTDTQWSWAASNLYPDGFPIWVDGMGDTRLAAVENNQFNHQLVAFYKATARLAQYVLSVGRDEVLEDRPTGALDDNGDPVTESVVVQKAILPLPATVDGLDYTDPENPVAAQVPNPAIVTDEAERLAAQGVIKNTPQEVKDFGV